MSLLVESENLGEFVNILTADGKYSRHNRENFPQLVQMQLFWKSKAFCQFFIALLKFTLSFEHLEKKISLRA